MTNCSTIQEALTYYHRNPMFEVPHYFIVKHNTESYTIET